MLLRIDPQNIETLHSEHTMNLADRRFATDFSKVVNGSNQVAVYCVYGDCRAFSKICVSPRNCS